MKFLHLYVILAAALFLAGCGKKDAVDSSGSSNAATVSGGASATFNGQTFQSPRVAAYLRNFDQYSKDYVAALNDNSQNAALKTRSDALAKEQREVVKELKGADEVERFNSTVMGIRKRIEDATSAATQK
jgi:major membrane immunogen (membrane-anchored lipoprotein)